MSFWEGYGMSYRKRKKQLAVALSACAVLFAGSFAYAPMPVANAGLFSTGDVVGALLGWILAKAGYGARGPKYTPKPSKH